MRTILLLLVAMVMPMAHAYPDHAPDAPRLGDAAEYVLQGAEGTRVVHLEWLAETVWLPTGETHTMPTLRALAFAHEERLQRVTMLNPWNDANRTTANPQVVSLHWTTYPGAPYAWSMSWAEDGIWFTRTSLGGGCAGQATLVAWADPSCRATGADRERHEGWPVAIEAPVGRFELAGHARGDGPLPSVREAGSELPRVPLVRWTPEGPTSGDLDAAPFRDARNALVAQSPTAASWMARHEDARVMEARHVWQSTLTTSQTPAQERVHGTPCTSTTSAATEWQSAWLAADGSLFTIVQATATAPAIHRVVAAKTDGFASRDAGGAPSELAPAPAALAEQLHLVPARGGDAAAISYAFLPDASVASVSRATCTRDTVTGGVAYDSAELVFVNGTAESTLLARTDARAPTAPPRIESVERNDRTPASLSPLAAHATPLPDAIERALPAVAAVIAIGVLMGSWAWRRARGGR